MNTYPNATHYSQNFSRKELNCRCGKVPPAAIQAELVKQAAALEKLRKLAGRPLSPNSGWRCDACNIRVGGAKGSFHRTGKATDIDCLGSRAEVDRLAKLAEQVPEFKGCGIGRYYDEHGFFVHVDRGPRYWRGINGV